MGATNTNYVITPEQTGMVMAFSNRELVADQVMPIKKLRSKSKSFKYAERNLADGFTVPSTLVGRTSLVNQTSASLVDKSDICKDHGLGRIVPQEDIDEADGQVGNLVSDALAEIMDLVLLGREKRVAEIVQDSANYLPAKVIATEDKNKFNSESSDPLKYLLERLDKNIVRPNRMIIGQKAWTQLRLHPTIVKAMHGNAGDSGVASRQIVAELLELDEIIIGRSLINTNKKGKELNLELCWGNNVALHYYEPIADVSRGLAWGMTFQAGERVASTIWDEKLGLRGGYDVKAGASWAEVVTAKGAGMLLTGVI